MNDSFWLTILNIDLPQFLGCGFVISHYSRIPATAILITLKAKPLLRRIVLGLSQRMSSSHHKTFHVGFLLDNLAMRQDDYEHFILPYQYLPNNKTQKISFSYHQIHTTILSINETNLPFSVQEFQSVPLCVGSNNCNNSNEVFIFNRFLMSGCKELGWIFGWFVCVYSKYMSEKWREKGSSAVASPAANSVPVYQYKYYKHFM